MLYCVPYLCSKYMRIPDVLYCVPYLCSKYMRTECLNNRYAYDAPLPINRLVAMVGSKSQIPTQRYGRRPVGVGLLVAGYDVSS